MKNRKSVMLVFGAIALVAIAGSAFAYWTGSGSGSGAGTAGTSSTVTLVGTVGAGLAPGTSVPVTFTSGNADTSPIRVTTVHLDGISVDGGHAACETDDLSMADVTQNHQVPAGATTEALPVNGSLVYANTAVNQDACQGATLTLTLSSI